MDNKTRSEKMRIDHITENFYFNDYIKLDIKQLMFDFYDHTPEKVWPDIMGSILRIQEGLIEKYPDYKYQILEPDDFLIAKKAIHEIWLANKDSLEKWEKEYSQYKENKKQKTDIISNNKE